MYQLLQFIRKEYFYQFFFHQFLKETKMEAFTPI